MGAVGALARLRDDGHRDAGEADEQRDLDGHVDDHEPRCGVREPRGHLRRTTGEAGVVQRRPVQDAVRVDVLRGDGGVVTVQLHPGTGPGRGPGQGAEHRHRLAQVRQDGLQPAQMTQAVMVDVPADHAATVRAPSSRSR